MNFSRKITVAFTGHRDYNGECNENLRTAIRRLYAEGYRVFLSGMAVGFDLAAAEAVLELAEELPDIRLVCIVPFAGSEKTFPATDKARYKALLERASEAVVLASTYSKTVYRERNDFLVDNSSTVIAYCARKKSGSGYTVARAKRCGMKVENLWENPQQKIVFE